MLHEEKEPDQHESASSCWFVSNRDVLKAILEMEERLNKRMALIDDVLVKIDTATTNIAANVSAIATIDQTISDEIDAFVKAAPPGTVLTDAQVTQLQGFGDRLQASSDASTAQVTVLKAIAAKGATNPVPVPVPPPPVTPAAP